MAIQPDTNESRDQEVLRLLHSKIERRGLDGYYLPDGVTEADVLGALRNAYWMAFSDEYTAVANTERTGKGSDDAER